MSDPITPEPAVSPSALMDTMSVEQRDTWRKTGAFPGDETPAAEPIAQPAAEPAKVEATEEADPAPGKGISKRQQQINDLIRERATAQAERDALKAEVEALRKPAAAQPQAQAAAQPAAVEDKEPTIDDFMDAPDPWAALVKATAKYEARQLLKADRDERAAQQRATEQQTGLQQAFSTFQERETAYKATAPDYDAKTLPIRNQIFPQTPIFDVVMDSPIGPALVDHFADHLDVFDRLSRLQQVNPYAALRELGKLEEKLSSKLASSASAAAAEPIKHVSSAPVPPVTLGSQAHAPVDDAEAALARGDFRAYKAEANRRDLAARR